MGNQKTTLELRIELAAKEAQASVTSLNSETIRLAQTFKDMNLGTAASQTAMKKLETFTASAAKQMQVFGASSADVRKTQSELQATVKKLIDDGIDPESESIKKLAAEYKKLGEQSKELDTVNDSNLEGFNKLKDGITASAEAVALVKVLDKAREFGSFALESADTFQKARNEFGTLLGDMKAGAGLFDRIKAFNDITPFNLETTKQGVNVLRSADVPLSDLNAKLTMFGDLSQGNAQKFTSFINAFAKGAAKGAVDMEVLNVYLDQGLKILPELAKAYDTTGAGVIKMASEGKVSFEDFSAALSRLAAEGGKYYGGMALGAKDLSAMQEGLNESTAGLAASYGTMFLPAAKAVLGMLTNITNTINDSPLLKGNLVFGIIALAGVLATMAIKAGLAFIAQMQLNFAVGALNPYVLAATVAVAALAAGFTMYATSAQNADKASNAAALRLKEIEENAYNAAAAISQVKKATENYTDEQLRGSLATAQANYESLAKSLAIAIRDRNQSRVNDIQSMMNDAKATIDATTDALAERKDDWIDKMFGDTQTAKIKNLQDQLSKAKGYLGDPSTTQEQKDKISAIIAKLQQEIADANKKANITVSLGTDWQDKNLTGIEAINREQEKSLDALNEKARGIYKGNYATQADYVAELGALNDYYDAKRAEALKKQYAEIATTWRDKSLSAGEQLTAQLGTELAKLADQYNKSAQTPDDEAAYQAERAALLGWEAAERTKLERNAVLAAHELRLKVIKDEWEYQKELARQKIEAGQGTASDYGTYASGKALGEISNTDVGALITAIKSGTSPILAIIDIVISAVASLDSFQKALNFITNFVNDVFEPVDSLIDDSIEPLFTLLDQISGSLSDILPLFIGIAQITNSLIYVALQPLVFVLTAVSNVFKWLYNSVIVPIGNKFIDIVNGVIDALNHIPFVNIKKLDKLKVIDEASQELADAISAAKDKINDAYDDKIAAINDILDSQIDSLKKKLELGLMSYDDYVTQVNKYQATADTKIDDLETERNKMLAAIEAQTDVAGVKSLLSDILAQLKGSSTTSSSTNTTSGAGSTTTTTEVDSLGEAMVEAVATTEQGFVSGIISWFDSWWPFADGSTNILSEMPSIVHPGEIIVPKSFADGVRSGDLTISGGSQSGDLASASSGSSRSSFTQLTVNLTVQGSVTTEKDLVKSVHEGISQGILSGELDALPEAS
jgi:tape measure domain-containing protein